MATTIEKIQATIVRAEIRIANLNNEAVRLEHLREAILYHEMSFQQDIKLLIEEFRLNGNVRPVMTVQQKLEEFRINRKQTKINDMKALTIRKLRESEFCLRILTADVNPLNERTNIKLPKLKRILRIVGSGYTPAWALEKWRKLMI